MYPLASSQLVINSRLRSLSLRKGEGEGKAAKPPVMAAGEGAGRSSIETLQGKVRTRKSRRFLSSRYRDSDDD